MADTALGCIAVWKVAATGRDSHSCWNCGGASRGRGTSCSRGGGSGGAKVALLLLPPSKLSRPRRSAIGSAAAADGGEAAAAHIYVLCHLYSFQTDTYPNKFASPTLQKRYGCCLIAHYILVRLAEYLSSSVLQTKFSTVGKFMKVCRHVERHACRADFHVVRKSGLQICCKVQSRAGEIAIARTV